MRGKEYWLARLEIRAKALRKNDQEILDALDNERDNHNPQQDANDANGVDYQSLSRMELVWRVLHSNDTMALDTLAELPEFSRSALFHLNRKHLIEARIDLNQTRYYGGLDGQEGEAVLGYGDIDDEEDGKGETYV